MMITAVTRLHCPPRPCCAPPPPRRTALRLAAVLAASAVVALSGCGGSISLAWSPDHHSTIGAPAVAIDQPSTSALFSTDAVSLALAGGFEYAAAVWVQNTATGVTVPARLDRQGIGGRWSTDALALAGGDNLIVVTADYDGSGHRTAADSITIRRPLP